MYGSDQMKQQQPGRGLIRHQQGFTLVEVLVTTVVMSIGLLGLAGLQTVSMRNNHSAYLRSQAVQLAYDIADRVRANAKYQAKFHGLAAAASATCASTNGCNDVTMAKNDLYQWKANITSLLPAGDAIICKDATPDDGTDSSNAACDNSGADYTVKIWWNDDRTGNSASQRFVMSFRP